MKFYQSSPPVHFSLTFAGKPIKFRNMPPRTFSPRKKPMYSLFLTCNNVVKASAMVDVVPTPVVPVDAFMVVLSVNRTLLIENEV